MVSGLFPRNVWDFVRSLGEGVGSEVRGWRFDFVGPRFRVRPSVSDVTSVCPTRRDVFLRRVGGLRFESESMVFGRLVHEAFLFPFRVGGEVSGLPFRFERYLKSLKVDWGVRRVLRSVFEKSLELYAISRVDCVPVSVEPYVPASPIGLSDHVRPDVLVGFIPVEVTTSFDVERKEMALAAYALAVEAWVGHPVDYGVVAQILFNGGVRVNWRVITIDDILRRKFLDLRDSVARMLEYREDPGVADNCPSSCPFRGVCHGNVSGRARV